MTSMAVTAKKIDAGEPTVTYTATFTPGEDGWICAQIVELPEAISQGRTLEEAKNNVIEALEAAIAWRLAEGESLPEPGQVTVGPVTVARP
jgi:predicted RNase H-like HicB family nuclease